ncbi:MAG: hypothetical protein AB7V14_04765, partial [Kiritimatiellia bacterium]
ASGPRFSLSFGSSRAIFHLQQASTKTSSACVTFCCDSHWLMRLKNGLFFGFSPIFGFCAAICMRPSRNLLTMEFGV